MGLRWDWLGPVMTVPYVPTIGPVHPDAVTIDLFADVVNVAGTGKFLAYDKDRRWSDTKLESVLVDDIVCDRAHTLVPTLSRRGAGTVSVFRYGNRPDGAAELATGLCREHGAASGRVVWFAGPDELPPGGTRVHLREFSGDRPTNPTEAVVALDECPMRVQSTFARVADELSNEGFAFLHERLAAGGGGPVLVTVDDGRVVGAIGPMEIMADSAGSPRLLPQYFGVLPHQRRRGHGRALWRAAMHWGHANGASYQLLQTAVGGASDRLFRAEHLRSLGFVCVTHV